MSSFESATVLTGLGLTCNLFRFAYDLILSASQRERKVWLDTPGGGGHRHNSSGGSTAPSGSHSSPSHNDDDEHDNICNDCNLDNFAAAIKRVTPFMKGKVRSYDTTSAAEEEKTQLVGKNDYGSLGTKSTSVPTATAPDESISSTGTSSFPPTPEERLRSTLPLVSFVIKVLLVVYFAFLSVTVNNAKPESINPTPYATAALTVAVGLLCLWHDPHGERYTVPPRLLSLFASLFIMAGTTLPALRYAGPLVTVAILAALFYVVIAAGEVFLVPLPTRVTREAGTKMLSAAAALQLLRPYFWPDATDSSAALNRVRAILTWVCVASSKACNLGAPILIGRALTALSVRQYGVCVWYGFAYVGVQFFGGFFKEMQSLVYLKVAQDAYVQLAEVVFRHLLDLSLDWHLRKKLGETIRAMDRGIQACDTLMKYLFLWLIPAITECLLVCVLFASYFHYLPLAVTVFFFVFVYMVLTILLTLWRKKFRKTVAKRDNDWHDRCTDSMVNFETVKYFTAEDYEMERFSTSVKAYKIGSVNVAISLSVLNIFQQIITKTCLGTALALAVLGIKQRTDCCLSNGCITDDLLGCCSAVSQLTCPGMEIGDFVAVMSYTVTLFQPLNFLGSVYNAIVMAVIDLTNMSELMAEQPDVKDAPRASILPRRCPPDTPVIEFRNVRFHYPTQPPSSGLHNVSFTMKKGTVTALVGKTGAGKSTVSRLLFRFYDVLDGCVMVNGQDVRVVTQTSLRDLIGVVPQNASLFNDSLRTNILYGKRDATQEELDRVAKDAQLLDFIHSLKDGWETQVGDRGLKLSGGEKQRVAIARCLLKNPPIVVLDEATSALDTVTENSVQEALDRLGNERTCLVIAHRLGTIRNADNIIVLGDGGVLEQGTHDELLEKEDGVYAGMWNMQLHERVDSRGNLKELDVGM